MFIYTDSWHRLRALLSPEGVAALSRVTETFSEEALKALQQHGDLAIGRPKKKRRSGGEAAAAAGGEAAAAREAAAAGEEEEEEGEGEEEMAGARAVCQTTPTPTPTRTRTPSPTPTRTHTRAEEEEEVEQAVPAFAPTGGAPPTIRSPLGAPPASKLSSK